MDMPTDISPDELREGLRKIRLRRWALWVLIMAYLPMMIVALGSSNSGRMVVIFFVMWVLLLIVAVARMALARCPRCGNCFHMSGYLFRPVRRCFECGLHLNADKQTAANKQDKSA